MTTDREALDRIAALCDERERQEQVLLHVAAVRAVLAEVTPEPAAAARVEWRVYVEPFPGERWAAGTLRAVDEAHARVLARHRKFARITKVTTWETSEEEVVGS